MTAQTQERRPGRVLVRLALSVGMAFFCVNRAQALPILPGFDLFETQAGETTVTVDLGSGPVIIPIRADPLPLPGNPDTIIERMTGIDPFDPPGGMGTITISVVALSLKSVAPVVVNTEAYSVHIDLTVPPPTGTMMVIHTVPEGGTFDSMLPVTAMMTFTEVGNPGNQFTVPFTDTLNMFPCFWSHAPGPLDAHSATWPAGNFYAAVDPATAALVPFVMQGTILRLSLIPATIPEPGSATLFAVALVMLSVITLLQRRRNKQRGRSSFFFQPPHPLLLQQRVAAHGGAQGGFRDGGRRSAQRVPLASVSHRRAGRPQVR